MRSIANYIKEVFMAFRAPANEGVAFQVVWVFFSLIVIFMSILLFI